MRSAFCRIFTNVVTKAEHWADSCSGEDLDKYVRYKEGIEVKTHIKCVLQNGNNSKWLMKK